MMYDGDYSPRKQAAPAPTQPEALPAPLTGLADRAKLLGDGESVSVTGQMVYVDNSDTSLRRCFDFTTQCLIVIDKYKREGGPAVVPFAQLGPEAQAMADILRPLVKRTPVAELVRDRADVLQAEREPPRNRLPQPRRRGTPAP